jgi:hypothetical protein
MFETSEQLCRAGRSEQKKWNADIWCSELLHENVHLHAATYTRALLLHFSCKMTIHLAALISLQVTTTCLTT